MTSTSPRKAAVSASIILVTVLTAVIATGIATAQPESRIDSATAAPALSAEQQELVDFARDRFAGAGLDLPAVSIIFETDPNQCFGYGGIYVPSETTVRICRPSQTTMVHELAHAWVETSFTESDRSAFLQLRGLETWVEGAEWDQRGAEHAAEIITWAIMDRNISIRWIETAADGTAVETWKLHKLPNSSPDELIAAYEHLTGMLPVDRIADDPRNATTTAAASPEAGRG